MPKSLKGLMIATDVGFLIYWTITFLHLIPPEYLYQDYHNELLVAWNLSFVPLDLFISITGLWSISCYNRGHALWKPLAIVSLVMTSCSGLQAIAFWSFRLDLDPMWWTPNLFLLIYPLFYLPRLIKAGQQKRIGALTGSSEVSDEV
ncbi:YvaD family protein [Paenibacillus tarimensis]|uniref:YvaD family protein n=1 Tax=Paenibacillus tarimensis TaxID=416012 RepID=UPI001F234B6E|nr:YvaD family protein [Paenibacillus tarimensis]MCF2945129.1 YvaD family protein [Paenibacillus tarimensis]